MQYKSEGMVMYHYPLSCIAHLRPFNSYASHSDAQKMACWEERREFFQKCAAKWHSDMSVCLLYVYGSFPSYTNVDIKLQQLSDCFCFV